MHDAGPAKGVSACQTREHTARFVPCAACVLKCTNRDDTNDITQGRCCLPPALNAPTGSTIPVISHGQTCICTEKQTLLADDHSAAAADIATLEAQRSRATRREPRLSTTTLSMATPSGVRSPIAKRSRATSRAMREGRTVTAGSGGKVREGAQKKAGVQVTRNPQECSATPRNVCRSRTTPGYRRV